MPCEDHAVMDVVEQFGFDGCHSLTASPGRQPETLQGPGGLFSVASSIWMSWPKAGALPLDALFAGTFFTVGQRTLHHEDTLFVIATTDSDSITLPLFTHSISICSSGCGFSWEA
eukprot:XP_008770428.1 PREDICTED: uncharacterized protein LOC102548061 isoform X1 [Rattus norvegicus]